MHDTFDNLDAHLKLSALYKRRAASCKRAGRLSQTYEPNARLIYGNESLRLRMCVASTSRGCVYTRQPGWKAQSIYSLYLERRVRTCTLLHVHDVHWRDHLDYRTQSNFFVQNWQVLYNQSKYKKVNPVCVCHTILFILFAVSVFIQVCLQSESTCMHCMYVLANSLCVHLV